MDSVTKTNNDIDTAYERLTEEQSWEAMVNHFNTLSEHEKSDESLIEENDE